MTEEQQTEQTEAPQVSEAEQQAMELGWQPEETFKADPKNEGKRWRSAEDFLDRKPLFDKIDELSKEVKNNRKALQSLSLQSQKAKEIGYKQALEDLKNQKKEALDSGDHEKVVEIDDKITDIKAEQKAAAAPPEQPQEWVDWVGRNSWYKDNPKLKAAADGIGLSYINKGLPPAEVLELVEKDVKELFPAQFERRPRVPPTVENGARKTNVGNGIESVKSKMSDQEIRIMNTIVKTGLSEADYIKQFAETQPERFKGVKL